MNPFILQYAESKIDDSEVPVLEYSHALSLSVLPGTTEPAINFAGLSMETVTKNSNEPTDHGNSVQKMAVPQIGTHTRVATETSDYSCSASASQTGMETHTFVAKEATDLSSGIRAGRYLGMETVSLDPVEITDRVNIARIAKRMSFETLTEARESSDSR